MATLNLAQRTAILMLLLNLALAGCWGGNMASSPPEGSEAETVLVESQREAEAPLAPVAEEASVFGGDDGALAPQHRSPTGVGHRAVPAGPAEGAESPMAS